MAIAALVSLPGLVIMLVLVAFVDQLLLRAGRAGLLPWRASGSTGQVSATGFEQLHASLSPAKDAELRHRRSSLMLRDEEGDGAPPRAVVDLDGGTATIRPRRDQPPGGTPRR